MVFSYSTPHVPRPPVYGYEASRFSPAFGVSCLEWILMAIVESGGVQRIDGSKDLSAQLRSVNGEISVLDEKLSKLRTERNALEKRAKHLRQLITDSRLKPSKFAQTCMSHDWSGPQGKFFCDRALFALVTERLRERRTTGTVFFAQLF